MLSELDRDENGLRSKIFLEEYMGYDFLNQNVKKIEVNNAIS